MIEHASKTYDEWRQLFVKHKDDFYRWKATHKHTPINDVTEFWRLFRWWYWNVGMSDEGKDI